MIGHSTPRTVAVQGVGSTPLITALQGLMDGSEAVETTLQSISDPHGILELLLIEHPSFTSPVRVVNDTRDWRISGNVWVGLPFTLKLPSQVQKENPRASLVVDNVGRELTALLEDLPVGSALTATIRVATRATPTAVAFEFVGQLTNISINQTAMTCSFGNDDTMRQSAVRLRFDPTTAPALFAG